MKGEFEQLRPCMAHAFPFELDLFQKEACLLLEQVHFTQHSAYSASQGSSMLCCSMQAAHSGMASSCASLHMQGKV